MATQRQEQATMSHRMSAVSVRPGQTVRLIPWHRATGYEDCQITQVRRGASGVQLVTQTGKVLRFSHGDKVTVLSN